MIERAAPRERRWPWAAAAAVATAAVFARSAWLPLLDWDDRPNLVDNPMFGPPTLARLRWMFATHYRGPYQPLSWLSLSLDRALWGPSAAAFHLTNVALHALNASLVFLVLRALLELSWPSAKDSSRLSIAALGGALAFALHPLRVESVAWVTERRDVLSGFFFLLTLLAYVRGRVFLALLPFALALLSKATAVGFVWAALAVDIFPLRRFSRAAVLEKWPFFALALGIGLLNLRGFATGDLRAAPYGFGARLLLYVHAVGFYALKTILPLRLSPYYPLPVRLSDAAGELALGAAGAATLLAFAWLYRRRPAIPAALGAYALMIAPMSGLAQNGQQLAADRYSYLACLPFAALASGALASLDARRSAIRSAALAALLAAGTVGQLGYWRSDAALWTRAVDLAPGNYLALSNLAVDRFKRGETAEAAALYERVLALQPRDTQALLNLGTLREKQGDLAAARALYERALALDPADAGAANNLAVLAIKTGDWRGAAATLSSLVERRPDLAEARFNLGALLAIHGRRDEGLTQLRRAVTSKPELAARLPKPLRDAL